MKKEIIVKQRPRKSVTNTHSVQAKLPSGHSCEAISTLRPLKSLTTELLKDEWPYKITIVWGCFSRKYRYKVKSAFESDLAVLKTLTAPETVTHYHHSDTI